MYIRYPSTTLTLPSWRLKLQTPGLFDLHPIKSNTLKHMKGPYCQPFLEEITDDQ